MADAQAPAQVPPANNNNNQHEIPAIPPDIANYIEMRLNGFRETFMGDVMAVVQDMINPMQLQLAHLLNQAQVPAAPAPKPIDVCKPPAFDGSRELGDAFIKSCMLYLQLRANDFPTVAESIGWILSFMNSGRAQEWRSNVLQYYADNEQTYKWTTIDEFVAEFKTEFLPINEKEEALITLEGRSFYQGKTELVDAYVDRFRSLVKRAGLEDPGTLVIKFRRGLTDTLAQTLSDSSNPPPSNDLDRWIARARDLERSRSLHRTITSGKQLPTPAGSRPNYLGVFNGRPSSSPSVPHRSASTPARPQGISVVPRAPPLPPSNLMDVDATRMRARTAAPTDVCRRCRQPGHWIRDCPFQHDVRTMTVDELEARLAAAKDMETAQQRADEALSQADDAEEAEEDFGATSG